MTTLACLALIVYFECRSCTVDEQVAVAYVAMNRARDDGEFGQRDDACEVLSQPGHWAEVTRPRNAHAWRTARLVARAVLAGTVPDPTRGALWFHRDDGRERWWSRGRVPVKRADWRHVFWRRRS